MMQEERSKEHNQKDEELMRVNGAITDGSDKARGGGGGGGGEGEGGIPALAREEG